MTPQPGRLPIARRAVRTGPRGVSKQMYAAHAAMGLCHFKRLTNGVIAVTIALWIPGRFLCHGTPNELKKSGLCARRLGQWTGVTLMAS